MLLVYLIAVVVGLLRIHGVKDVPFQWTAHLFCLFLFLAAVASKKYRREFVVTLVTLSILEVICFFAL